MRINENSYIIPLILGWSKLGFHSFNDRKSQKGTSSSRLTCNKESGAVGFGRLDLCFLGSVKRELPVVQPVSS